MLFGDNSSNSSTCADVCYTLQALFFTMVAECSSGISPSSCYRACLRCSTLAAYIYIYIYILIYIYIYISYHIISYHIISYIYI